MSSQTGRFWPGSSLIRTLSMQIESLQEWRIDMRSRQMNLRLGRRNGFECYGGDVFCLGPRGRKSGTQDR